MTQYDVVVDGLENKLSLSGDESLTVEKMRDKLNDRYQRILDHKEEEKGKKGPVIHDNDVALATYMKQFKGNCRHCGKIGHKKFECPDNPQKKANNVQCWYCGGIGHRCDNCEKLKEKAGRGEYAHCAMDDNGIWVDKEGRINFGGI